MLRILVTLLLWGLAGCVYTPEITAHKQSEAMRLVDQGTLLMRVGDLDQAQASFQVAMELADLPQAVDGLGCIALLSGQFDVAERLFVHAYNMDPEYNNSLGNLALLYDLRGLSNQSESVYRMALESEPNDFRARNNYAAFLARYRGTKDAAVRYELLKAQVVKSHPIINENIEVVTP